MRLLLLTGLLLLAAVPWLPAGLGIGQDAAPRPQDAAPKQGGGADPFHDVRSKNAKLSSELLGTWQLVEARMNDATSRGEDAVGFMVVQKDVLSLEMHLRTDLHRRQTFGLFFQTGVYRWRFDGQGRLEATGMVGTHNMTRDEKVEFEVPGRKREFAVTLDGDELVLLRTEEGRASSTTTWKRFRTFEKQPAAGER
jgi:hypothetical protein